MLHTEIPWYAQGVPACEVKARLPGIYPINDHQSAMIDQADLRERRMNITATAGKSAPSSWLRGMGRIPDSVGIIADSDFSMGWVLLMRFSALYLQGFRQECLRGGFKRSVGSAGPSTGEKNRSFKF